MTESSLSRRGRERDRRDLGSVRSGEDEGVGRDEVNGKYTFTEDTTMDSRDENQLEVGEYRLTTEV